MKILLRPHLKIRLKERNIPEDYPSKIVSNPEEKYYDSAIYHQIAIKKLVYNGKIRPMAVAYDIIGEDLQIITIHPTTKQEINSKVRRERWIKDE